MVPALLALALAVTVPSPDGAFTVDAPGWQVGDDAVLRHDRDAFTVTVRGAGKPGDLGVLDYLRGLASKDGAGIDVYTWLGDLDDGRQAACVDTRKSTSNLKAMLRTYCGVQLPGGDVAVLVMESRDVLRARTYGARAQDLLYNIKPVGAPPASPVEAAAEPAAQPADAPVLAAPADPPPAPPAEAPAPTPTDAAPQP